MKLLFALMLSLMVWGGLRIWDIGQYSLCREYMLFVEWILLKKKDKQNYLTMLTLIKICNTLLSCSSQKQDKGKNHNIYEGWGRLGNFWCTNVFLALSLCLRFLVGNSWGMFLFNIKNQNNDNRKYLLNSFHGFRYTIFWAVSAVQGYCFLYCPILPPSPQKWCPVPNVFFS